MTITFYATRSSLPPPQRNFRSSALSLEPSFGDGVVAVAVPVAAREAAVAAAAAWCCTVAAIVTEINSANCFICDSSNMLKKDVVLVLY